MDAPSCSLCGQVRPGPHHEYCPRCNPGGTGLSRSTRLKEAAGGLSRDATIVALAATYEKHLAALERARGPWRQARGTLARSRAETARKRAQARFRCWSDALFEALNGRISVRRKSVSVVVKGVFYGVGPCRDALVRVDLRGMTDMVTGASWR